jgi:hypothetical protein
MAPASPRPLAAVEHSERRNRIVRLARTLRFVGRVEYRHVYSRTGGAQYGQGSTATEDLLTVYAEAFERDADTDDFSLGAILAHERGHQLLARHPRIAGRVVGVSEEAEEILASLLGAIICTDDTDRTALLAKATADLLDRGQSAESASRQIQELYDLFEALL